MPWLWKAGLLILIACLVASMAIAIVRLTTTPQEILGDGFRGLAPQAPHRAGSRPTPR
jgi:hypothetical protein